MTAFKTIKGVPVKTVAGGQPNAYPSPFEGELFYDSDGAGAFKFVGAAGAGAWSSGGNLATARSRLAGAGTQALGLCMGGHTGSVSNVTEEYTGGTGSYDELFTAEQGL